MSLAKTKASIRISPGNTKTGRIPAVSGIPGKDCGNCSSCVASCYAMKAWRQYPGTRNAWGSNSTAMRADPYAACEDVVAQLRKRRKLPALFRIHVAGDFLGQHHVNAWSMAARELPTVRFLAFTKMHGLDYSVFPENATIVHSMWPGLKDDAPAGAPRAWCQDGTEDRVPANALECPGNCETCGMCWNLNEIGRDVVFEIH